MAKMGLIKILYFRYLPKQVVKYISIYLKIMNIRVIIEWDEEAQVYSATCPELNFVSSFGDTKEQAIEYLKDAINLMFELTPNDLIETNSKSEVVELTL